MTTMEKIKPCPFCGAKKVEICRTNEAACWVRCDRCGADAPSGWLLPREKVNDLQAQSIAALVKRSKQAHYINVRVRINGRWEEYEADWIKHLTEVLSWTHHKMTDSSWQQWRDEQASKAEGE